MIVDVSVIGRSSQCKTNFLRAASIPERRTSGDSSSLTVPTWWTTRLSPREGDIDQVPRDSFCSSGYRLLPARLKNHTAADVIGEKDEVKPSSVLLVISCDLVFYCGKPRSTGDAANSVKTVVTRLKDRLGGEIPFVVAVSIDVEYTSLETSKAKDLLSCVSSELAGLGVRMITVSPRTELWLRDQQNEGGRISYRLGASTFRVRDFSFGLHVDMMYNTKVTSVGIIRTNYFGAFCTRPPNAVDYTSISLYSVWFCTVL